MTVSWSKDVDSQDLDGLRDGGLALCHPKRLPPCDVVTKAARLVKSWCIADGTWVKPAEGTRLTWQGLCPCACSAPLNCHSPPTSLVPTGEHFVPVTE